MEIGKQTYGLLLISDNWNRRLRDAGCINALKSKLEHPDIDIKYVNSWPLFGVHDTAVLVRSEGRLDPAVDTVGDWVQDCTTKINNENVKPLPSDIAGHVSKYNYLSDIYKDVRRKKFKIFEYRIDPLIPIHIDAEIESGNGVFLIMYIKFNPESVNNLLNGKKGGNLGDLYKPFIGIGATSVFHGFGLFDIVVITKRDTYEEIEDVRTNIRIKFNKPSISDTYSLTSVSQDVNNLGFPCLNSFMRLKIRPTEDDPKIWGEVRDLAKDLGLSRICVREAELSRQSPTYTSYIPGFFDVEVDVQFTNIEDLINFWDALEHMYFVEDTATVISYDTNVIGENFNETSNEDATV